MKLQVILSFCILWLFVSCYGSSRVTKEEEVVDLRNTKWQLRSQYDLDAWIQFKDELDHVYGYNGCDDFSADIVVKNYEIELTNFISNTSDCDSLQGSEREFMVALSKVNDFDVSGDKLLLYVELGRANVGDRKTSVIQFNRVDK